MKKILLLSLTVFFACQEVRSPKQEDSTTTVDTTQIDSTALTQSIDTTAIPPKKHIPDYDTTSWTDISFLDTSIIVDMKYATTENFVETKMYNCGRCFLRPEVATAVVAIQKKLNTMELGLKMYDCFRPRPIQYKLWEKVPDPRYVSDPKKGSMHNRGAAIDVTLVDKHGKELEMGTKFDFFGRRAYQNYTNLPDSVLANRVLLRETMLEFGFKSITTEWWHYSYTKKFYELSDMLWNCD